MCVSCWQPEASQQQKPSVRFNKAAVAVCRRMAMMLACQNRRRNHDICMSSAAVVAMLAV